MHKTYQDKLAVIFSQEYQIKRLTTEINSLNSTKDKNISEHKLTTIKNECLIFKIKILPDAYKNTSIPQNLTKLPLQYKIIAGQQYPSYQPRVYFLSETMIKYGIQPFRQYCLQILNQQQWNAAHNIAEIIKMVPLFLQKCIKTEKPVSKFPIFQEYFELDYLYSWKFCQIFPVQLIKHLTIKQGFILINMDISEIIILEETGVEAILKNCDYIQGSQIKGVFRKKNQINKFILQLRKNYQQLNGKFGIQFICHDIDPLLLAIIQCAKISQLTKTSNNASGQPKKIIQSSEDQDQDQKSQEQPSSPSPKKKKNLSQRPMSIAQIEQEIVIYLSQVQSKRTCQNVNELTILLQKAIEYYSAHGDERYKIHVSKMHEIFSDDITRALIQSQNQQKIKSKSNQLNNQIQQQFKSILDFI